MKSFWLTWLIIITDYAKGFGGKYGVQEDRKDKSALGWEYHAQPEKHQSQTEYKKVRSRI